MLIRVDRDGLCRFEFFKEAQNMDAVFLSRLQFGFTAGFHFLFPPLTLGLTLIIFILETLYLKSNRDLYKGISTFLIRILGLVFVMGVATGIVLEFSFGTNWSEYSRVVGDIFGAPLAAEGIFAFFLESVFIGILIFGRERVSRRVYWFSSLLVLIASHLSGLWIIIANSWMQTPAGYRIEGGRAVLENFFDAVFNPSTIIRFFHTIIASWITGSLFAAGISAWYLLRKRSVDYFKPLLRISLIIFIITSLLQLASGHTHSVQVAKTQPEKLAAFEALWDTRKGAPLSVFGIPFESEQKTYLEISIPKLLSLLAYLDPEARVPGLNEFPRDNRPPVFLPFATYHLMFALGMFFIAISLLGGYLFFQRRIYQNKWYLWTLVLAIPLPFVANEFGWIAAEVGRQPWAVYRILRTAKAASVSVPAEQILFTLIVFILIYILLFAVFLKILLKILRKGPEEISEEGY
jgi:cytochrome d ubiquinol oxidase subunit I